MDYLVDSVSLFFLMCLSKLNLDCTKETLNGD